MLKYWLIAWVDITYANIIFSLFLFSSYEVNYITRFYIGLGKVYRII